MPSFRNRFKVYDFRQGRCQVQSEIRYIDLPDLFFLGFHDIRQLRVTGLVQSPGGTDDTGQLHLNDLPGAPAELNITQPAVTKGIQRLQEYYEIKFVERLGKRLVLTEVLEENLLLIVSPRHRLATMTELRPRDLEGQAMIMHEYGSALQMALERLLDEENVHISKYLEFSNNEAIKRAVAEGNGIALISEKVAAEEIKAGKLISIPVSGQKITRSFYMIQSKDKFISRPLAGLLEMIQKWTVFSQCGN